jgi:hypothetical protein
MYQLYSSTDLPKSPQLMWLVAEFSMWEPGLKIDSSAAQTAKAHAICV